MKLIKSVKGKTPQISNDCYIAENATIVGDVKSGHLVFPPFTFEGKLSTEAEF